jgi:flavin-binding protein dodecin
MQEGVIKVIELVGVSQTSWSEAAKRAVEEASRTLRGITGIEVQESSATVENGQITEYRVLCKIAFPIMRGGAGGTGDDQQ